jgi:UTP:GlnB (protein PII) uridylyltransferase
LIHIPIDACGTQSLKLINAELRQSPEAKLFGIHRWTPIVLRRMNEPACSAGSCALGRIVAMMQFNCTTTTVDEHLLRCTHPLRRGRPARTPRSRPS